MYYFLFQNKGIQLLCRRTHVLKSLPERYHRQSFILQIKNYLCCIISVICYFTHNVLACNILYVSFNSSVVNYIPLCCSYKSVCFPYIIRNMVTSDTLTKIFFRYPKIRNNYIFFCMENEITEKTKALAELVSARAKGY